MKRITMLAIALATTLMTTAAYAAPSLPQIQAPRGEDPQAPRGSNHEIQAPRGENEQAARA